MNNQKNTKIRLGETVHTLDELESTDPKSGRVCRMIASIPGIWPETYRQKLTEGRTYVDFIVVENDSEGKKTGNQYSSELRYIRSANPAGKYIFTERELEIKTTEVKQGN